MNELVYGVAIDLESDRNKINIGYFDGVDYAVGDMSFILNEHISFDVAFSSQIKYEDEYEEAISEVRFNKFEAYGFVDTDLFSELEDFVLSDEDIKKVKAMIEVEIKKTHDEEITDYKRKKQDEVNYEKWLKNVEDKRSIEKINL